MYCRLRVLLIDLKLGTVRHVNSWKRRGKKEKKRKKMELLKEYSLPPSARIQWKRVAVIDPGPARMTIYATLHQQLMEHETREWRARRVCGVAIVKGGRECASRRTLRKVDEWQTFRQPLTYYITPSAKWCLFKGETAAGSLRFQSWSLTHPSCKHPNL